MEEEKTFKVILTEKEIMSILDLAETEFSWNKNADKNYPYLDSAIAKLERFENYDKKV